MTGTLLSFGHGYSARALARLLVPKGWSVIGTTRSEQKARALDDEGIEPVIWPGMDLTPAIGRATHILSSVSPNDEGDPVLRELAEPLAARASEVRWAAYLSTTGVYGDHGGGWVSETTPLAPSTERGRLRVQAESEWQAFAARTGLPLHIFRLAGIYGPDRGPFAKVRAGTARRIVKSGQVFSRTHVDDIAQTLAASIGRPYSGRIYNVCDDDPAPPQDVITYAARLLNLPTPPEISFEDADLSSMARSFYAESKRVRNDRIKDELGVELLYPTYRAGLEELLNSES